MTPENRQLLRVLILNRRTASLATLHGGDPAVSMVPFSVTLAGDFIVHVSGLASHTLDMLTSARVGLMITAAEEPDAMPQALPRVSIAADARQLDDHAPDYAVARDAYLVRFPDSEPMFSFGDFSLFAITPRSLRLVGGFAQATTLAPADLLEALSS